MSSRKQSLVGSFFLTRCLLFHDSREKKPMFLNISKKAAIHSVLSHVVLKDRKKNLSSFVFGFFPFSLRWSPLYRKTFISKLCYESLGMGLSDESDEPHLQIARMAHLSL